MDIQNVFNNTMSASCHLKFQGTTIFFLLDKIFLKDEFGQGDYFTDLYLKILLKFFDANKKCEFPRG